MRNQWLHRFETCARPNFSVSFVVVVLNRLLSFHFRPVERSTFLFLRFFWRHQRNVRRCPMCRPVSRVI